MKNLHIGGCILFFLLFLDLNTLQAQKITFENVASIKLKNSGVISNDGIVKGYYFFYFSERLDDKNNEYVLEIVNQNLEVLSRKTIKGSRNFKLLEGAYNGINIMLKFYDPMEKILIFKQYDENSDVFSNIEIPINPRYAWAKSSTLSTEAIAGKDLFAIPDKGFINLLSVKTKKVGYRIDYFPEDETKGWSYSSDPDIDYILYTEFLTADENMLLINIVKRSKMSTSNVENLVAGFDINTGEKLFETSMNDKTHPMHTISAYIDPASKQVVALGNYFQARGNAYKSKSLGMFACEIDKNGNINSRKLISWEKDVSKYLPINKKGKINSEGFLYFHNLVKSSDGNILAIGEQFRKGKAITLRTPTKDFSNKNSNALPQMVELENIYIFRFNPDFSLLDIKKFEKNIAYISMSNIDLMEGAHQIGRKLNFVGAFDYQYTQKNNDSSVLTVGYINFERRKGEKNGYVFGAITYTDGKYSTDKIDLLSDATSVHVLPAKPGYVMIAEYYKEAKKLETRLEKINF